MVELASAASTFAVEELGSSGRYPRDAFVVEQLDPLEEDQPSDAVVPLTNRQLARLLFIAAETGGRVERDGSPVDPIAWLFSPRQLFSGQAAVQACQGRMPFIHAIVLHGLSLGFDADPEDIARLIADDDELVGRDGSKTPSALQHCAPTGFTVV